MVCDKCGADSSDGKVFDLAIGRVDEYTQTRYPQRIDTTKFSNFTPVQVSLCEKCFGAHIMNRINKAKRGLYINFSIVIVSVLYLLLGGLSLENNAFLVLVLVIVAIFCALLFFGELMTIHRGFDKEFLLYQKPSSLGCERQALRECLDDVTAILKKKYPEMVSGGILSKHGYYYMLSSDYDGINKGNQPMICDIK
jgi:hypothetical protein